MIWKKIQTDLSMWALIATNLAVIVWAAIQKWSPITLMWIYWAQSIGIGVVTFITILALKQFSTKDYRLNREPCTPTRATKIKTVVFFVFHYGLFVTVHAGFLASGTGVSVRFGPVVTAGAMFFASQLIAFLQSRKQDDRLRPNIGKLLMFPYARIVPIHITVLAAKGLEEFGITTEGLATLLPFLCLKTVVDVVMHARELRGFEDKPSKEFDTAGPLTRLLTGKTKAQKAARKIRNLMDELFSGPHEYEPVNAGDFKRLDLDFYARTAQEFESQGFDTLGDFENKTVARINPKCRTFCRCLVSPDRTIAVGINHLPAPWLLRLLRLQRQHKGTEIRTELSDGCFLCTANVPLGLTMPPQIDFQCIDSCDSPLRLLDIHRNRVRDYLKQNPDVSPVRRASIEEVHASQHRLMAVVRAHRKGLREEQWEEELRGILKPEESEHGEVIVDIAHELGKKSDDAR